MSKVVSGSKPEHLLLPRRKALRHVAVALRHFGAFYRSNVESHPSRYLMSDARELLRRALWDCEFLDSQRMRSGEKPTYLSNFATSSMPSATKNSKPPAVAVESHPKPSP